MTSGDSERPSKNYIKHRQSRIVARFFTDRDVKPAPALRLCVASRWRFGVGRLLIGGPGLHRSFCVRTTLCNLHQAVVVGFQPNLK
jgi:hypothetical protein